MTATRPAPPVSPASPASATPAAADDRADTRADARAHRRADDRAEDQADLLRRLEVELLAMPPVAALGLRVAEADDARLCLRAPLAPNVNDKGCAFGGSLSALMTLAGWSLLTLRLMRAGVEADVYVAESEVKYRVPLFEDLRAEARPTGDAAQAAAALAACVEAVASHGRGELHVDARVRCADGTLACRSRSRFVAKRRVASGAPSPVLR